MVEWPLVAERRPMIIVKGMIREWDSMWWQDTMRKRETERIRNKTGSNEGRWAFESYSKDSHRKPGNWASEESGERLQARGKSAQAERLVTGYLKLLVRGKRIEDPRRLGHLQKLYHTPHIWDLAIIVKEPLMVRKLAHGDCRRQEVQIGARIRMGTERPGNPGRGRFPHTLHITIHLSLTQRF